MVSDEKFVYDEHFKDKWEMYGKLLQQGFSFSGREKLILTVFCMQEMFSPHTSVPRRDYLLMKHIS